MRFSPGVFDGTPASAAESTDARADGEAPATPPPVTLEEPALDPDQDAGFEEIELSIDADDHVDPAGDWEEADSVRAFDRVGDQPEEGVDTDVELPEFDPAARIDPWRVTDEPEDRALGKARLKAASLATELEFTTRAELGQATRYLTGLFAEAQHSATLAALRRLASEGLDFETLRAMVALRREWNRRSDWWVHRFRGRPEWSSRLSSAMTWRLAHDVCHRRFDHPPEHMIDDEWLDEWYRVSANVPGYYSFAWFVGEKVESSAAQVLVDGLQLAPGDHREARALGDHHSDLYWLYDRGRDE